MNLEERKEAGGKLIRITKEADEALSLLMQKVNSENDAVRISKLDLASFILEKFCPTFSSEDMKDLYMRFIDEVSLLKMAYKQAVQDGSLPDNLREILFKNAGLTPEVKKVKKTRQCNGSNATQLDVEAA